MAAPTHSPDEKRARMWRPGASEHKSQPTSYAILRPGSENAVMLEKINQIIRSDVLLVWIFLVAIFVAVFVVRHFIL
jgi:hypothetical protein